MSKVPIKQLLELSVADRMQLIDDLWESVAADSEVIPLNEAQKQEARRRLEEHRANPGSAIPWEQLRRELYERYG